MAIPLKYGFARRFQSETLLFVIDIGYNIGILPFKVVREINGGFTIRSNKVQKTICLSVHILSMLWIITRFRKSTHLLKDAGVHPDNYIKFTAVAISVIGHAMFSILVFSNKPNLLKMIALCDQKHILWSHLTRRKQCLNVLHGAVLSTTVLLTISSLSLHLAFDERASGFKLRDNIIAKNAMEMKKILFILETNATLEECLEQEGDKLRDIPFAFSYILIFACTRLCDVGTIYLQIYSSSMVTLAILNVTTKIKCTIQEESELDIGSSRHTLAPTVLEECMEDLTFFTRTISDATGHYNFFYIIGASASLAGYLNKYVRNENPLVNTLTFIFVIKYVIFLFISSLGHKRLEDLTIWLKSPKVIRRLPFRIQDLQWFPVEEFSRARIGLNISGWLTVNTAFSIQVGMSTIAYIYLVVDFQSAAPTAMKILLQQNFNNSHA